MGLCLSKLASLTASTIASFESLPKSGSAPRSEDQQSQDHLSQIDIPGSPPSTPPSPRISIDLHRTVFFPFPNLPSLNDQITALEAPPESFSGRVGTQAKKNLDHCHVVCTGNMDTPPVAHPPQALIHYGEKIHQRVEHNFVPNGCNERAREAFRVLSDTVNPTHLFRVELSVSDYGEGDISVQRSGRFVDVHWHHHITAAALCEDGLVYALDPVTSRYPQPLDEWAAQFTLEGDIEIRSTRYPASEQRRSSFEVPFESSKVADLRLLRANSVEMSLINHLTPEVYAINRQNVKALFFGHSVYENMTYPIALGGSDQSRSVVFTPAVTAWAHIEGHTFNAVDLCFSNHLEQVSVFQNSKKNTVDLESVADWMTRNNWGVIILNKVPFFMDTQVSPGTSYPRIILED